MQLMTNLVKDGMLSLRLAVNMMYESSHWKQQPKRQQENGKQGNDQYIFILFCKYKQPQIKAMDCSIKTNQPFLKGIDKAYRG